VNTSCPIPKPGSKYDSNLHYTAQQSFNYQPPPLISTWLSLFLYSNIAHFPPTQLPVCSVCCWLASCTK